MVPRRISPLFSQAKNCSNIFTGTLYIPDSFLRDQTPGQRQWWLFKSDHYDKILFFKMGKFYELFHMDALIGVERCGLTFMKNKENAHAGFPEKAFERYVEVLVNLGYKVARIGELYESFVRKRGACKIPVPK